MILAHSFWSIPFRKTLGNYEHLRSAGGWYSQDFFFMSILLSCLKVKSHHDAIHLVTDTFGKRLLIDRLELPYSSYNCSLDMIDQIDPSLWAIGKIVTYDLLNEPFLHLDNDVFLYQALPGELLQSNLIVQNFDTDAHYYQDVFEIATNYLGELPSFVKQFIEKSKAQNRVYGCNAGIIGGHDLEIFKSLKKLVFSLLKSLKINAADKNFGLINMFLEQTLFLLLAQKNDASIIPLFETMDLEFERVLAFENIPQAGYIHAVGKAKRAKNTNEQIYLRLLQEYPDELDRLMFNLKKLRNEV